MTVAHFQTLSVFGGGIGDFLLALPAMQYAARDGYLDLVGPGDRTSLAVEAGIARRAFSFDQADFHTAYSEPSRRLVEFLAHYDRVMVWLGKDAALENRLREAVNGNVQTFPGKPSPDWGRHAGALYAQCVGADALEPLLLKFAPADRAYDVIIHPGSGSARKNWPIEHFLSVANSFEARGESVAWSLGPAERESGLDRMLPKEAEILLPMTLVELARTLVAAKRYVGNDSGITHLAAATGCRTTAVFVETGAAIWAPKGEHVSVVDGRSGISIDAFG